MTSHDLFWMCAPGDRPRVWRDEVGDHEEECSEQHLQLAMDTVLSLTSVSLGIIMTFMHCGKHLAWDE